MDETLWCPADPNSDVSQLRRATQNANGRLWDSAYDKIQLPALKIGDAADINDNIAVGENSCVSNLYKIGQRATVKVYGELEGSGFFVSPDGLIATAAHVVPGPENTVIVDDNQGNRFAARVKIEDVANDVAILKVVENRPNPTPFNHLKLRDQPLQRSEPVAAFGHPKSWSNVYMSPGAHDGHLSHSERAATKDWKQANQIAAIRNHVELGNSGGPLVDNAGRAVGVVVGRYTNRSDLSLVIPTPAVKAALTDAQLKIGVEEGRFPTSQDRTRLAQGSSHLNVADSTDNYYTKKSLAASVGGTSATISTVLSSWGKDLSTLGDNAKSLVEIGVAVAPLFAMPLKVKPHL